MGMSPTEAIGSSSPAGNPGAYRPSAVQPSQHFSSVIAQGQDTARQKQEMSQLAKKGNLTGLAPNMLMGGSGPLEGCERGAIPETAPRGDLAALLGLDKEGQREGGPGGSVVRDEPLEVEGLLDPLARALAGAHAAPIPSDAGDPRGVAVVPLADPTWFKLLRRVAWGGSKHSGAVYLEFGSGALAGAGLTLTSAAGRVSVVLELPPGVGVADWEQRLQARLARRGIDVLSVTVR